MEKLRYQNYPIRLKTEQFVKVQALAEKAGLRPYEIVDQVLEYGLGKARVGMVTRPGLVFDQEAGKEGDPSVC